MGNQPLMLCTHGLAKESAPPPPPRRRPYTSRQGKGAAMVQNPHQSPPPPSETPKVLECYFQHCQISARKLGAKGTEFLFCGGTTVFHPMCASSKCSPLLG